MAVFTLQVNAARCDRRVLAHLWGSQGRALLRLLCVQQQPLGWALSGHLHGCVQVMLSGVC